ncbi:MAG: LamG domain-containing protein, partial [Candidatus Aenigmatarchaeota archaeon]
MTKAISAVISTVMLLMITVSLIGVFYVFSSTLTAQTTSSGGQQASQLTAQLSMCMQVDNIIGNQIVLRNCGKGLIENKSLVVMMDDIALGANTQTIQEGNSSIVDISGLWNVPFGKHSLKISNGAAVALALVEIIPNPDGLAGSWNFDEGSGGNAYDSSGNGNVGILTNMNTSGNATSGWTSGKFGNGLRFDGTNDYVDAGNGASLNITSAITISAWVKFNSNNINYAIISKKANNIGYTFAYRGDINKQLRFVTGNGTAGETLISNNNAITDNSWHYVSVVFVPATSTNIYVDDVNVGSPSTTQSIVYDTTSLRIGQSQNANYFSGTIDEVRVWS